MSMTYDSSLAAKIDLFGHNGLSNGDVYGDGDITPNGYENSYVNHIL